MKKIGIIITLLTLLLQLSGQERPIEKTGEGRSGIVPDTNDNAKVVIGEDLLKVENNKDAFKVRVGDRGLNILESLEGRKFSFENYSDSDNSVNQDNEDHISRREKRRQRFTGHWAGLELGFNNYVTSGFSSVMPEDINYMSLHSSKSMSFNLNFSQLSLGFSKHAGIVTGLGLNWNNFVFDGQNNIKKGDNGVIEALYPGEKLDKSKLTTIYLMMPVLLEGQIPANNHHINMGAGLIGAVKLGSHSRMNFENADKVKSFDDFNLNLLRYGATARVGYQNFQFYGTYYFTPLFKSGTSPGGYDLYPFEIGFSLCFND